MGFKDGLKSILNRVRSTVDAAKTSKTVDEWKKMREVMKDQGFKKGFEKVRAK